MPHKRAGLAAVIFDDKIYVIGGIVDSRYLKTMEAYDLENGEWKKKASMKETRAYFCVRENNLYYLFNLLKNYFYN